MTVSPSVSATAADSPTTCFRCAVRNYIQHALGAGSSVALFNQSSVIQQLSLERMARVCTATKSE